MPERAEHGAGGVWDKLTRRKVVQWGIAYSVGAWGFLQGLEYVSDAFGWPEQLRQVAILALLVGLPVVLVVAWYHGDRGEQRVSGTELAIISLLFLLGGGIFWRYDRAQDDVAARSAAERAAESAAAAPGKGAEGGPSIAVLPFVNMSNDPENEYFSDGISEELLNALVRVPGIGVASRTSSFAYKGSTLGTAAIARELKVGHILEGSVRKAGNRVRITAQLIDAQQDRHLWSETYDRQLDDIFAIQGEIANAIVAALRGKLDAAVAPAAVSVRADTENLEAYDQYLKARELFIARRDLPESVRLFERVVELDPTFARGWEGLAAVRGVMESWGYRDRPYSASATEAAKRALELDPSLSMPWAVLGLVATRDPWPVDYERVLDLMARAVTADSRNATALLWRSMTWMELGFFDRANADLDRCLELEPNYPNAQRHKALALLLDGQVEAGLALFERSRATGFRRSREENFIGPLLARGDTLAVQLLMDDLGFDREVRDILLDSLQHPGPPRDDRRVLVEKFYAESRDPGIVSLGLTHLYLWLGDFERAAQQGDTANTSFVTWDRYPPGFRNSPQFKRRLERSGVAAYWREHGYPRHCRPVGASDFTCD